MPMWRRGRMTIADELWFYVSITRTNTQMFPYSFYVLMHDDGYFTVDSMAFVLLYFHEALLVRSMFGRRITYLPHQYMSQ